MRELSAITAAHLRAFEFLDEIMELESDKIMLDEDCIVVSGQLATYCIKIDTLLKRLRNPIVYGIGFDTISVHAKGKLDNGGTGKLEGAPASGTDPTIFTGDHVQMRLD